MDRNKLEQNLRWHQSQLYHFLGLYYNKDKFTDQERDYYKKFTDSTYRKHLAKTAELQDKLNEFASEAIF
jgi:hypothetical protein